MCRKLTFFGQKSDEDALFLKNRNKPIKPFLFINRDNYQGKCHSCSFQNNCQLICAGWKWTQLPLRAVVLYSLQTHELGIVDALWGCIQLWMFLQVQMDSYFAAMLVVNTMQLQNLVNRHVLMCIQNFVRRLIVQSQIYMFNYFFGQQISSRLGEHA